MLLLHAISWLIWQILTTERRKERGRETFLKERKDSIKAHYGTRHFWLFLIKRKKVEKIHKAVRRKNRNRTRQKKIGRNEQRRYMNVMIKGHANQIIMKNEAIRERRTNDCVVKTQKMKRIIIERKRGWEKKSSDNYRIWTLTGSK